MNPSTFMPGVNIGNQPSDQQKCVILYLVGVYQVENQINVSMHGLVLSQLRLHFIQPVNESLEGIGKLPGEQQGLLQLVLSAEENK